MSSRRQDVTGRSCVVRCTKLSSYAIWITSGLAWGGCVGIAYGQCEITETKKVLRFGAGAPGVWLDHFGQSVAIAGDFAAVGAPLAELDFDNTNHGMVFRYERQADGTWSALEYVVLPNLFEHADDEFGFALDIDEETGTLIIGEPNYDDGDPGSCDVGAFHSLDSQYGMETFFGVGIAGCDFGRAVAIDGGTVVVAAGRHVYIFERDANDDWVLRAELSASDVDSDDGFGGSVAIDDGVVVVGAPGDDGTEVSDCCVPDWDAPGCNDPICEALVCAQYPGCCQFEWQSLCSDLAMEICDVCQGFIPGRGAAYVFEMPAGGWVDMMETAKLIASDAQEYDSLGGAVTIHGDTVIAGARNVDTANGVNAGAVYVFERPASGWTDMTETTKLEASDGAENDLFGTSVDFDGQTAIIGASHLQGGPSEPESAGSAYLFVRTENDWVERLKLVSSDAAGGDEFGFSVAIDGDTAIVGAIGTDDGNNCADIGNPDLCESGAAYIYDGLLAAVADVNGSGVADGCEAVCEAEKLLASDGDQNDHFGQSVSVSADVAVVGAYWGNDNGTNPGSAYVHRWNGSSWVEEQKLLASDGAANDRFGHSVSVSADVVVVGAYRRDDSGTDSGSAYVYRWNGSSWVEEQKLLASDGAYQDRFGHSISVSGDVALVGAVFDNSAYVYRWNGAQWVEEQKLLASDGSAFNEFGYSVSVSGDVALVGAVLDDDNGTDSGSAYVYRWNGAQWVEEQRLLASDGSAFDGFGWSVTVSGDVAIVGAGWADGNDTESGSAYVYWWNGSSWVEEQKLLASDGAAGDRFGNSVSVSGDVAVVGAHADNDNGGDSGSVYVFAGVVDTDCNGNGFGDLCDIIYGSSEDCNDNMIPDNCDIADGTSLDLNGNGIPDECDPGACCLEGGSCTLEYEADCIAAGGTYQGDGTVCTSSICAPSNDECANAISLGSGNFALGTTIGATLDVAASCDGVDVTAPGVWYSIIGSGAQIYVTTCHVSNTTFDTMTAPGCAISIRATPRSSSAPKSEWNI
jgi:hypothetical protein